MFGLSEAHYNIVKRHCRECSAAIKDTISNGSKYDHVAAATITKHHAPVATIITRGQFIWLCGYLNGRFGQAGEYE
jgi:hypothetical protein